MSDFQEMLKSADVQGNEEETPTPPTETDQDTAGNDVTPTDTPPAPTEDDLPDDIRTYLEQNPDHKAVADVLNKHFKAAFTPKLQEAAELRKQLEGLEPTTIQTIRQLQELSQTNPALVAQYFRQQAELIEGAKQEPATPTPTDPFSQYEPATDVEAVLLEQVKELKAWREQQEQTFKQREMQTKANQVMTEFNQLEKELGMQIPLEQRAQVWEKAEKAGWSIQDAYFAMNRSTLLPTLMRKAKDEASQVIERKATGASGNPGGVSPRMGDGDGSPSSFGDFYRQAMQSD